MVKLLSKSYVLAMIAIVFVFSGCSMMNMGSSSAKTAATGSASGSTAEGENSGLERCSETLGTLAVHEETDAYWYRRLREEYKLGPLTPVLKLLAQQSNCFVVVERGKAMSNIMQERALEQSGELRESSNFKKGQLVAADFTLNPSLLFSEKNAGGGGGAVAGVLGGVVGGIAAAFKSSEAGALLTLIENRSGVQVVAAEGSAKNTDFGGIGGLFGGSAGTALGGYSNTNEGKVIAAALTDAFNNIVRATKSYKAQTVKGGLGTGKSGKLQVN
jgi:hypothetical protein